jgi:hypothetical protein
MTVAILGKFEKQSGEILDYDVDFTKWFAARGLTPDILTVVAEAGITVVASSRTGAVVKIVLSGGTSGTQYKVTVTLTSTSAPSLKREADFMVKVKDI